MVEKQAALVEDEIAVHFAQASGKIRRRPRTHRAPDASGDARIRERPWTDTFTSVRLAR